MLGTEHWTIVRMSPHGEFHEFAMPPRTGPAEELTVGSEGNIWFTWGGFPGDKIGRITAGGVVSTFPVRKDSYPWGIAAGPKGTMWFTEERGGGIGYLDPEGRLTRFTLPVGSSAARGIVAGPDGNLWFTEYRADRIGRITPGGAITEFPLSPPAAREISAN